MLDFTRAHRYRSKQRGASILGPVKERTLCQASYGEIWAEVGEYIVQEDGTTSENPCSFAELQQRWQDCSVYPKIVKVSVYPSMVDIEWDNGEKNTLSVKELYEVFAAHFWQNGLWDNLNFARPLWRYIPKEAFELGGMGQGWVMQAHWQSGEMPTVTISREETK